MTKKLLKVISLGGVLLLSSGVVIAEMDSGGPTDITAINESQGDSDVVSGSAGATSKIVGIDITGKGGMAKSINIECRTPPCKVLAYNKNEGKCLVMGDGMCQSINVEVGSK